MSGNDGGTPRIRGIMPRVRGIRESDIEDFFQSFQAMGWHKPRELFIKYLREQESGERGVFVAEVAGKAAGYVTLVPKAKNGPFAGKLPEVVDFNVLPEYRRRGVGARLMDAAEARARELSPAVSIGFGLHPGYGSAQRMYVKRGYVPDGSGVWYQDRPLAEGEPCRNDDSLVLYLVKRFAEEPEKERKS